MSIETEKHAPKPKLPSGIEPCMLSFDVYGTLINTPPWSLQAFRSILLEAPQTNLDPIEFYSFWEQSTLYGRIQIIQRDMPNFSVRGILSLQYFIGTGGVDNPIF